jgi:DNA-directed RNA polymerase subunit M/transcription elongation factor TFIIS
MPSSPAVTKLKSIFGKNLIKLSIRHEFIDKRAETFSNDDIFFLYELKASTDGMDFHRMEEFMKITARRMKPNETQLGNYAFLGFFANPHFRSELRLEMFDIIRKIQGPTLSQGLVECGKCHSKQTTSEEFSNRSADEATRMRHYCNICNRFWMTN